MRHVNIQRSWARVADAGARSAIGELSINGLPGFLDATLTLRGSMFILCGGNAVGKSRLLSQIHRAARGLPAATSVTFVDPTFRPTSRLIDPGFLVGRQRLSVLVKQDLDERLAAAEFAALRADAAVQMSYVLGIRYDSLEVAELDADDEISGVDEASDDSALPSYAPEVVPYFKVTRGGRTYVSMEMSHGELVAATLVWALARSEAREFLLVEEPDSSLSPVSSSRCLDLLATVAHSKSLTILVTSHSATGLSRSPVDRVLLLKRATSGLTETGPANIVDLSRELEIPVEKAVNFYVEDAAGHQWLQEILASRLPQFASLYEVLVVGGEGEVRQACRAPTDPDRTTVLSYGIFDGDQRADPGTLKLKQRSFLPGLVSPEGVIRQFLLDGCPAIQGVDVSSAVRELQRNEGLDIHDQVSATAHALSLTVPRFRSLVWAAYCETEQGKADVDKLVSELMQLPFPQPAAPLSDGTATHRDDAGTEAEEAVSPRRTEVLGSAPTIQRRVLRGLRAVVNTCRRSR